MTMTMTMTRAIHLADIFYFRPAIFLFVQKRLKNVENSTFAIKPQQFCTFSRPNRPTGLSSGGFRA
jgi:hypothetical protein